MKPTIGRIVIYRTDGRNGLSYDLPAMINCTQETHPGNYEIHHMSCATQGDEPGAVCTCTPTIRANPLPVPIDDEHVHLTVFTPGGYGTSIASADDPHYRVPLDSSEFATGVHMVPGSGTYVELNVPHSQTPQKRTWRWPTIQ